MTGPELKQLRVDLSEAIGRELTAADMAKLCGQTAAPVIATSSNLARDRTVPLALSKSPTCELP
jgi:hypothetical protein